MPEQPLTTAKQLYNTIFNTAEFKEYAHESRQEVVETLKDHEFSTLLDLDCGTGMLLEQLYEAFPNMEATGFDYAIERIDKARERLSGKNIQLDFGQAIALPYDDASFDVVVSTSTFHHYNQPERVLEEVHRVLKPGGTFILEDTYLSSMLRYLNKISKPVNEVAEMSIYSKQDIWRMFNSAGFTGIQWHLLHKYVYMIQAQAEDIPLISEVSC